MGLDPASAAYFALIAICLILIGAILTTGALGVAERGTVLVAIGTTLFAITWRARRRNGGGE